MSSPILPNVRKQNLSHFLLSFVISGLSVIHSKFPFLFFLLNLVQNFPGAYMEEGVQEGMSGLWLPSVLHSDLLRWPLPLLASAPASIHTATLWESVITPWSAVASNNQNWEVTFMVSSFFQPILHPLWRLLGKLNYFHMLLWNRPKSLSRLCLRYHKNP